MDKAIRRFSSLDAMKAEEYAYWQSRPAHERMTAILEITSALYERKERDASVPRIQRTLVHLQRPQR